MPQIVECGRVPRGEERMKLRENEAEKGGDGRHIYIWYLQN